MTENRFDIIELEEESYPMILFLDNGKEMTDTNVVDCLNALHEENQSLKDRIAFLEEFITSGVEYTYSQNIYDENEQLQEENTELKNDNKRMVKFIMSKGFSLKDYLEWLNEEVWK